MHLYNNLKYILLFSDFKPLQSELAFSFFYDKIFFPIWISARSVHPETGAEQYMVSPITGEKILASKVQEHMRIGQ